ncbi:hypothetical protein COO60DRAFT_542275 [Scenedesmus sp. NREL 46B-D3]|nr:hypothetical protein COO60DRAFT_542275 [Scenedesmus sp. NREL 46B-D3]
MLSASQQPPPQTDVLTACAPAGEDGASGAGQQQGQQPLALISSRDVALAVAAGILQPVVLELEGRVRAAAAAAVAAPDDPHFKRSRPFNSAGDFDLDDDFPTPAPQAFSHPSSTSTAAASQQPGFSGFGGTAAAGGGGFGFSSQAAHGMGPPATKASAAAAAATAGSVSAAGPPNANLVTGGLAGFNGRASRTLGSRVLAPALAGFDPSNDAAAAGAFFGPRAHGFAVGGLGEGLAGIAGVEGAGLRVLAALSPACGPDAAQGLLQLWRTVSGAPGGAPSEQLLEALVETMCVAVCSGRGRLSRARGRAAGLPEGCICGGGVAGVTGGSAGLPAAGGGRRCRLLHACRSGRGLQGRARPLVQAAQGRRAEPATQRPAGINAAAAGPHHTGAAAAAPAALIRQPWQQQQPAAASSSSSRSGAR